MTERLVEPSNEHWKHIGTISVDAGLCIIGDPCYVRHVLKSESKKDWDDFCKKIDDIGEVLHKQVEECIVTKTGWGDGEYNVYAKIQHNKVTEIRISFKEECDDL